MNRFSIVKHDVHVNDETRDIHLVRPGTMPAEGMRDSGEIRMTMMHDKEGQFIGRVECHHRDPDPVMGDTIEREMDNIIVRVVKAGKDYSVVHNVEEYVAKGGKVDVFTHHEKFINYECPTFHDVQDDEDDVQQCLNDLIDTAVEIAEEEHPQAATEDETMESCDPPTSVETAGDQPVEAQEDVVAEHPPSTTNDEVIESSDPPSEETAEHPPTTTNDEVIESSDPPSVETAEHPPTTTNDEVIESSDPLSEETANDQPVDAQEDVVVEHPPTTTNDEVIESSDPPSEETANDQPVEAQEDVVVEHPPTTTNAEVIESSDPPSEETANDQPVEAQADVESDEERRMALKKREPPSTEDAAGSPKKRAKVYITPEERTVIPLSQAENDDPMIYVKFYSSEGWEWYVTAYNGADMLYGYVKGTLEEWGRFTISELVKLGNVERDISFKPQKFSALKNDDLKDVRHTIYA